MCYNELMARHNITNINSETQTGDCSVCGQGVRLKPYYGIHTGKFRCYLKYMENKHGAGRFPDGTRFTAEEHNQLVKSQGGLCAICKEPKPLSLDHCHREKRVRGLLCRDCNLALGNLKDNVEFLRNAIIYLESN